MGRSGPRPLYLLSEWLWTNYFPSPDPSFFIGKLMIIVADGFFFLPYSIYYSASASAFATISLSGSMTAACDPGSSWPVRFITRPQRLVRGGRVTQASPMQCPLGLLLEPLLFHSLAVLRVWLVPCHKAILLPNGIGHLRMGLAQRSRTKRNPPWETTFESLHEANHNFPWTGAK